MTIATPKETKLESAIQKRLFSKPPTKNMNFPIGLLVGGRRFGKTEIPGMRVIKCGLCFCLGEKLRPQILCASQKDNVIVALTAHQCINA